jgi:hypothetical protein
MGKKADSVDGFTIVKECGGWTLTDPEGDYLQIDGFGGVSPNYRAAVEERRHRIQMDRDAEAAFAASIAARS